MGIHHSTFLHWLNAAIMPDKHLYNEVHLAKVLSYLADGPTKQGIATDPEKARKLSRPAYLKLAIPMMSHNLPDAMVFYTLTKMIGDGIKLFRPSAIDCLSMENIDPKVPANTFRQPFPTMVVEIPSEYQQIARGYNLDGSATDNQKALACIIHHDHAANLIIFIIVLDNEQFIAMHLETSDTGHTRYLSEYINEMKQLDSSNQKLIVNGHVTDEAAFKYAISEQELDMQGKVLRIAINSCLLLTRYNHRKLGTTNDSHAERLKRRVAKRGPHSAAAEVELRCLPEVYGFDQNVQLYDTARSSESDDNGSSGGTKGPHWRSGHWAQQPHGPQHSLRKLIFRKPVLVNPHLLIGPLSNTFMTIDH